MFVRSRSFASYSERSSKLTTFLNGRRNWSLHPPSQPMGLSQPSHPSLPIESGQLIQYWQPRNSARPSQPSQSSLPSHTSNTCQPSLSRHTSRPRKFRCPRPVSLASL